MTAASSPLSSNVQTVPWWCIARAATLCKQCRYVQNVIDFCIKLVIRLIIRELGLRRLPIISPITSAPMTLGRGQRRQELIKVKLKETQKHLCKQLLWTTGKRRKRIRRREARQWRRRSWSRIGARLDLLVLRLCQIHQEIRHNWELGRQLTAFKQVFHMPIWDSRSLYWSVMYSAILEAERIG